MLIEEAILDLRTDHAVVQGLLGEIEQSSQERDRKKQLVILKSLLVHHFFVEEFLLYPCIRKKFSARHSVNRRRAFDAHYEDLHQKLPELLKTVDHCTSVGSQVIAMISELLGSQEKRVGMPWRELSHLIHERIRFEEDVLNENMMARLTSSRIDIQVPVMLSVSGKTAIAGTTLNINKTGCLLETDSHARDVTVGDVRFLHRLPVKASGYFKCKVIRVTRNTLAVQLLGDRVTDLVEIFERSMPPGDPSLRQDHAC